MKTSKNLVYSKVMLSLLQIVWIIASFGQLIRIPTVHPSISLQPLDIIVGITVIVWLINKFQKSQKPLIPEPLFFPGIALILIITVSWAFNLHTLNFTQLVASLSYLIRWISYFSFIIIVYELSVLNKNIFTPLISSMMVSVIVVTLLGYLQYLFFPDFHIIKFLGWDEHLHRLASTFLDPGYTGLFLVFGLLMTTPIIMNQTNLSQKNILKLLLWLLIFIAIGLTFSRASYIALIGGVITLAFFQKRLDWIIKFIVYFAMLIVMLPKPAGEGVNLARQSTVNFRFLNWQQAIEVIKDHPLVGIGFNRYRYIQSTYGSLNPIQLEKSHAAAGVDNSLLFVAATLGGIGLVIFLWLWKNILTNLWSHSQINPKSKTSTSDSQQLRVVLPQITLASAIAWFVHAQFHNSLFYPPLMLWMFTLIGVSLKEYKSQ